MSRFYVYRGLANLSNEPEEKNRSGIHITRS